MRRQIVSLLCLLCLFCLALVTGAGGAGARGGATATAAHREAIAEAQSVLTDLALPAGAAPHSPELNGRAQALQRPMDQLFFAAEATRHGFWTMPEPPAAVLAWIRRHRPGGTRWGATGFGGGLDGPPSAAFGSYTLSPVPRRGLLGGLVSVIAVATRGGPTVVRADAFVRYASPRPPDERIAGRARMLEIDVVNGLGHHLGGLDVTQSGVVTRLAAAVDTLPAADLRGSFLSCPAMLSATPIDRLTFRADPAAPALATITIASDAPSSPAPCVVAPLRVNGHWVGDMFDSGTVLRLADRLLGLRLARP